MKLIQLTDLHIDDEGGFPYDIDVRSNFKWLINAALQLKPDHLVITGDLCYRDGVEAIYEWILEQLEAQPMPFDIIAGNHDDSSMMARCFHRQHMLNEGEFYYAKRLGKVNCIFLDSAKGEHSKGQLKWLERQLKQAGSEVIIFMHHPPLHCGVPFMDRQYALKDMEAIQKICLEHPYAIDVFCGHYHVEKTVRFKNMTVHITPSSFFQLDQQFEDFKVDHHRIALREIEVDKETLLTNVRYYNGFVPDGTQVLR